LVRDLGFEAPQRLRLDAVRGLKHIKEAALDLALPDNTTKTGRGGGGGNKGWCEWIVVGGVGVMSKAHQRGGGWGDC